MEEMILKPLFLLVLSLSLSGTLIGILIAVIHPFTRKYFSKKWNYYIWLLVVIRLILPFHLEPNFMGALNLHIDVSQHSAPAQQDTIDSNKNNVDNTMPSTATISADMSGVYDNSANDNIDNISIAPQNTSHTETTPHTDTTQNKHQFVSMLLKAAAYVWIIGVAIALFIKMLNYGLFRSNIKKDCVRITDNNITVLENTFCAKLHIENIPAIYKSAAVSSPMTIGLWKPVIIMPENFFTENQYTLQLVLHHELVHVARKDLLYKWTYHLLLCVHWFNPVLYQIGRQINSDCELSCDEAILGKLTESGKQMYGNILLDTAAKNIDRRQNALSTTLLENKKDLKKRLDNILHYKKSNHFRLIISICTLAVMLTISACSSVWISSEKASAAENSHDESESDESGPFSRILTSLASSDSFMDTFSEPDQSSDAWSVYDDDGRLAGEDIQDNWGAYSYRGGGNIIKANGFVLYGSDTFLIAYADKDVDVKVKSSFDLLEGNFKIVYIAPDKSVVTLNDTGAETTQTITMKKGRNVLKKVGQGARLKNLVIDYTDLKESRFEAVYSSEEQEYASQVKDAIISGSPINKDKIINSLSYMDTKDASDLFHALLNIGTTFTDDELYDFFIYSDRSLSSQYLLEAIEAGTIQPPGADTISQLMPYLEGSCRAAVLKSLPVEEFYDVFAENICYLNSSEIDDCLTDFIGKGGVVTYSMYDEISPYLNKSIVQKLDKLSALPALP